MPMKLQDILGKQYLIAAYIEPRLQLANFIKEGYDSNKPILMNNRFLHFTAHNYYRSIVLDLYALFGRANTNSNKYSFFHINDKYEGVVIKGTIDTVQTWLFEAKNDIKTIELMRHRQIAHYDFEKKEFISLNFNHLLELNTLFDLARQIIVYGGNAFLDEEIRVGYDFGRRSHYVHSLERLIAKADQQ